jgi:Tfp pilus assembly protein PilF
LHPLNVESVAWLAERKNVLSTFFWLLTIFTYTYYVRKHNIQWYLGVVICFILGLMTKPMAVTLPFLMLLLDFWPLGRIQIKRLSSQGALHKDKVGSLLPRKVRWPIVVLEKVPLLILSAFSVFLSISSLQQMDIMVSGSIAPLNLRIANALVSYVGYINKMIWPHDLAIFYPYPKLLPTWQIIVSVLCLLAISILCIAAIKRRPYLSVGWLWYVGTLVPVIGIVQTGIWPAMADRWAYVPLIGLFIIIVWGFSDIFRRSRYNKLVPVVLCSVILMGFANATHMQLRHWVSSIPLFQHALQVTGDNEIAYYSIGNELVQEGRLAKGIDFYRSALRLKPEFSQVHNNLGVALGRTGNIDEAVDHFQIALQKKNHYAEAHNNLGVALRSRGQLPEAGQHYGEALRLDPAYAEAYNNLGLLLMQQGKIEEALSYFKKALEKRPDFINARENFKKATLNLGINN